MESSNLVMAKAAAAAEVVPCLPPEIIWEFLVRLPVRILLKLRCVSKQWYALITDPIFRASYRTRSKQNPPRILLKYYLADRVAFSSLDYCKDRRRRRRRLVDPIGGFDIVKETLCAVPCLDLVCLYDRRNMYIWNPATGDHIELPEYRSRPKRPSCGDRQEIAFGYLPSTTKYKILRIQTEFFNIDSSHCEVLTLGGEQYWKGTNGPPLGIYHSGVATFHGAAYLVRLDRGVVRFDLDREEWTSIEGPKPEEFIRRQCAILSLTELGGLLCLTDCDMHLGTTIWFLEDYDKGIWLWKYDIDVSTICYGVHNIVAPLVIEEDGRLLLHIYETNTLFCYESRSKSFEPIYFYSDDRGTLSATVYIESFKSLNF